MHTQQKSSLLPTAYPYQTKMQIPIGRFTDRLHLIYKLYFKMHHKPSACFEEINYIQSTNRRNNE